MQYPLEATPGDVSELNMQVYWPIFLGAVSQNGF